MISTQPLFYLLAGSVLTGACGKAAASPTAPSIAVPTSVRDVVVLGDSLAVSPSRAQAFPAHLQTAIERLGLPWNVVNAGISGDTTAGGLRRVEALLTDRVGVLVVALGA